MGRLLRWALLIVLGGLFVGVSAAAAAPAPPAIVGSVSNTTSLSGATAVAVSGSYAYASTYWGGVLTAVDISNPANPVVAGSSAVATSLFDGATVNLAGGYAFVASKNRNASTTSNDDGDGNALTILDVHTNPASPAIVGTLQDPANLFGAYGVAVSGTHAYVASQGLLNSQPTSPDASTGAFSVIDFSNIGSPTIVGHLDNGSLPAPWTGTNALEHATSVSVQGNYTYVTAFYGSRLTVIDISNPANPTIVASITDPVNLFAPNDVAVSGNYAYVANQTGGSSLSNFTVVDVSNPASPKVVGSIIGQGALAGAYRVRVNGNFAYVAASGTGTVAAIDISDPAHPRVAGAVTSSANLFSTSGLDFDPNAGYIIASSPLASNESNPRYPPYPMTTGTIVAIQLDPLPIALAIAPGSEPVNPTTQTTANFTFGTSDQVATFPQCQLDGAPFSPCTSPTTQTYGSLSPGSHTFTVETTDALGNPATASYTWNVGTSAPTTGVTTSATSTTATGSPIATAPANTTPPTISGTDAIGQTLTCAQGAWTGSPPITYAYSWTRDGTTIAHATRPTYLLGTADAKHQLACVVHARGFGSAAAASASLPAPAGSGQIGRPKLLAGGAVSVRVSCARISGTVCHLSVLIVGATKAIKGVVLASKSVLTLNAGQRKTITLMPDRAARKLLSAQPKLLGELELEALGSNGKSSIGPGQRVTLRSGKR